jgi:4-hydroxyproline epimerase
MAVLHARQRLALDEEWRQESITGSRFVGWVSGGPNGELIPHIRGSAFITGESTLYFDPGDPFRFGIGVL